MTKAEAVNWLINITADIGKAEHKDLWHYEQALAEIREMLESAEPDVPDTNVGDMISRTEDLIFRGDAIEAAYTRIKQIGLEDNVGVLSIRQAIREVPSVDFSEIKEQALSCAAELLKLVSMISKIEKQ